MLEMKPNCERCDAPLPFDGAAYICSFECSFCEACMRDRAGVCPNCQGELVRRPLRKSED